MRCRTSSKGRGLALVVVALMGSHGAARACGWPGQQDSGLAFDGITADGDMLLSDGTRGRLPGLRMRLNADNADALSQILSPWHQAGVSSLEPSGAADRWGRRAVAIFSRGGGPGRDLALNLLETGFAIVAPAELPPNCRIPYFQTEAVARKGARGYWSTAGVGLMDAAQGQLLAGRAGELVVMQGRVNHVGQTRRATFLNFGARGTGASAELNLSVWRELERQGWTRDTLRGQTLRVRGVVHTANPARMMITDATSVEKVD